MSNEIETMIEIAMHRMSSYLQLQLLPCNFQHSLVCNVRTMMSNIRSQRQNSHLPTSTEDTIFTFCSPPTKSRTQWRISIQLTTSNMSGATPILIGEEHARSYSTYTFGFK